MRSKLMAIDSGVIMGKVRTQKIYPDQFKDVAVALVREQEYIVPAAAKALGIN